MQLLLYLLKYELAGNVADIDAATRVDLDIRAVLKVNEERYTGRGLWADGDFFRVFSFGLKRGDRLSSLKGPGRIVISEDLGQRLFKGADPVGKVIKIDGKYDLTVTGILDSIPENSSMKFEYIVSEDTRLKDQKSWFYKSREKWTHSNIVTFFKSAKGKSSEELQNSINQIMERKRKILDGIDFVIKPFKDLYLTTESNFELFLTGSLEMVRLFSAIGLVILLLAFINYVNLTTARMSERTGEVAIRKIMGGTGKQLFMQHIAEATLFSIISMVAAIGISFVFAPFTKELTGKNISLLTLPVWDLFIMISLLTIATVIFAGFWPAMKFAGSAMGTGTVLKERISGMRRGRKFRNILTILQVTASVILLVATGTILKQVWYILNHDNGFERDRVLIVRTPDRTFGRSYEAFRGDLMKKRGIADVTCSYYTPARIGTQTGTEAVNGDGKLVNIPVFAGRTGDNFIEFYGMKILKGASFKNSNIEKAVIVNEALVKKMGWKNPLGVKFPVMGNKGAEIVGVVKDFNFSSLHNGIRPMALFKSNFRMRMVSIKIAGSNTVDTIQAVKEVYSKYEKKYPFSYSFLDDQYRGMYRKEINLGKIMGGLAFLAMIIAGMGLLGTSMWGIKKRVKEIGVRKVLGSSVSGIVFLLIKEFMKLVLIGNLIAWPVAWFIMNDWLEGFAYRIDSITEILVITGAGTALLTLFVIIRHAFKAAADNPVKVLRQE